MNNTLLLGGVAAIAIAGGAYFFLNGNSGSELPADSAAMDNAKSEDIALPVSASNGASDPASDDTQAMATTDNPDSAPSPSQVVSAKPILHPVEAVCIDYELSGQMINGTSTRCHRNYAYEQYEIQNTTVGMMGVAQTQNQHTITIGDTIYAIDLQTNTGMKTTNPMYAGLASAMENSTPEEMSASFIASMGFSPTGESKTIANTNCNMYSAAQLGNVCLTGDGLMLEQDFMGNTQTALSVSYGDGGDDANYTLYQNVPITDGPDLSDGIQGLAEQFGNQ